MGMDSDKRENNRARVRRLVIDPLIGLGFRFKRGVAEDMAARRLTQLSDDVGYLSDEGLTRLQASMRDKGEGSARCFWPERATFIAYAQMIEPRPIEDMPGMASWFASEAGARAQAEDRLVAEYRFWRSKHRPPMNDMEWRRVTEKAKEWNDRATLMRDRQRRGITLTDWDRGWIGAYDGDLAAAQRLVAARQEAAE